MPPHFTNIIAIRPRSLANILDDLKEARRDLVEATVTVECAPAYSQAEDEASDRAAEADTRVDDLRAEFSERFAEATGLTWRQIETAISEAIL